MAWYGYIFKYQVMKKVASYPKITSKTNITVTHTQNININSPKGMGSFAQSNKLFKNKGSMQAGQDSELRPTHIRPKTKPTPTKPIRRQSSSNLNRQDHPEGKTQIRKIEQKLKQLEKKIDTLKLKKKRKELSSQRSHSKIKDTQVTTTNIENRGFKKKEGSLQKVLKKTQSDKYLLRPPLPPRAEGALNLTANQGEGQFIQKFVTQVARSEGSRQHFKHRSEKVVCYYIESAVESMHKNYLLPFREHLAQSIQTLKYLQNNRKPLLKELQRHSVTLPPSKYPFSLVLDLDQTLIHCNQNLSLPHDVTLRIKFPTGQKVDAGINVRPFAKELLQELSKVCELIVFTASHECYANVVLDHLDPKGEFVSHRLFRSHCWQTQQGVYIKDLRVLKNRRLQDVLLVDNAAYSYFYQLENGIPIIPYYDDKDDQELLHLIHYVKDLVEINKQQEGGNTFQELNHRYFQLSAYHDYQDLELLTSKLYKETIIRHKQLIL